MSFAENLDCSFNVQDFNSGTFYACEVTSSLDNTNNGMVIDGYNGVHEPNKNDNDVKAMFMFNKNTRNIPLDIGLLFNLTVFFMYNTHLVNIKAKHFHDMQNLEELTLWYCGIHFIPTDTFSKLTKLKRIDFNANHIEEIQNGLFTNNINLESIRFCTNKIKFIAPTVFDGLTKLNHVDLETNKCINLEYRESTGIIQVKEDIKTKCYNSIEITSTTTTKNPIEF